MTDTTTTTIFWINEVVLLSSLDNRPHCSLNGERFETWAQLEAACYRHAFHRNSPKTPGLRRVWETFCRFCKSSIAR